MTEAQQIEMIAAELLPKFIPKDNSQDTLSFQFTIPPNITYRVNFEKKQNKAQVVWQYTGFEHLSGTDDGPLADDEL